MPQKAAKQNVDSKSSRLTAFDLSLTGTGFAECLEAAPVVTCSTLAPPKDCKGVARLDWILSALESRTGSMWRSIVIIEDMAFAAHDRNHERAGLAWMVRHMLWQYKIPYVLVAPTTLKKFCTGSGKGDKSKMQLEVYKHWHIDCANDNEADAVGLLYMLRALVGIGSEQLNKAQQECLAVVRKNNAEALIAYSKL